MSEEYGSAALKEEDIALIYTQRLQSSNHKKRTEGAQRKRGSTPPCAPLHTPCTRPARLPRWLLVLRRCHSVLRRQPK